MRNILSFPRLCAAAPDDGSTMATGKSQYPQPGGDHAITPEWSHEEGVPFLVPSPLDPGHLWSGWAESRPRVRGAWRWALRSGLLWPVAAALFALAMAALALALTLGRYPLALQPVLSDPLHPAGRVAPASSVTPATRCGSQRPPQWIHRSSAQWPGSTRPTRAPPAPPGAEKTATPPRARSA